MRYSWILVCALVGSVGAQSTPPWCFFQDLWPGANSSRPSDLTYVKELDRLFFVSSTATHGRELYVSDGTRVGTRRIDLGPGAAEPRDLTVLGAGSSPWAYGSALAFTALCPGGRALWVSDGTTAGTRQVTVPGLPCPDPQQLTDGTAPGSSRPVLYFTTGASRSTRQLWVYEHRTGLVTRILPSPAQGLKMVSGVLYFTLEVGATMELWRAVNFRASRLAVFRGIGDMLGHGPKLYFSAHDGTSGFELWESHISSAAPSRIEDLNPGAAGSLPVGLVTLGSHLYFAATTPQHGRELHRLGLNTGNIELVADIVPGTGSSSPAQLVAARQRQLANGDAGSLLYFTASTPATGRELWRTEGDHATLRLLGDLAPGSASSKPMDVTQYGDGATVVFSADTPGKGRELWVSEGTRFDTRLLCDVVAGAGDGSPADFVQYGSELFFSAAEASRGRELYRIQYGDAGLQPPIIAKFGFRGAGSPSYGSNRPHIYPTHVPRVGKSFGLFVQSARRNALALLVLTAGHRHTPIPLGAECWLHTGLLAPVIIATNTDATFGQAVIPLPIPATAPVGVRLTAQFVVDDPQGCFVNSLNVSDAMRIAVGR